jgi:hypothetical protein
MNMIVSNVGLHALMICDLLPQGLDSIKGFNATATSLTCLNGGNIQLYTNMRILNERKATIAASQLNV